VFRPSRLLLALLLALSASLLLPTSASAAPPEPLRPVTDCLAGLLQQDLAACAPAIPTPPPGAPDGQGTPAPQGTAAPGTAAASTSAGGLPPLPGALGELPRVLSGGAAGGSGDDQPAPAAGGTGGETPVSGLPTSPEEVVDQIGSGCEMLAGLLGLGGGCDTLTGLLDCGTHPTGPGCAQLPELTCETLAEYLPIPCDALPELPTCLPLGEVVHLLEGLGLDRVFDQLPEQLRDLLDALVCSVAPPTTTPSPEPTTDPIVQPEPQEQPQPAVVPVAGGGTGGGAQLAYTGVEPRPYLAAGVGALGLGVLLQLLGRRRA
jgi:hypothetical protein